MPEDYLKLRRVIYVNWKYGTIMVLAKLHKAHKA